MSGPILTVTASPIADSSHSFHPANSHSNLDLLSRLAQPPSGLTVNIGRQHRSTSQKALPNLPAFDVPSFDFDFGLDRDFDPTLPLSKTLKVSANEKVTIVQNKSKPEAPSPWTDKMGRRKALLARSQSWMPSSKPSFDSKSPIEEKFKEEENEEHNTDAGDAKGESIEDEAPGSSEPNRPDKSLSRSNSIASFAKRGWMSASRSPSPSPSAVSEAADYVSHREQNRERSSSTTTPSKLGKFSRKRPVSTIEGDGIKASDSLARFSTIITKMKQRPQSVFIKGSLNHDGDSTSSSVASLAPASTSTRPSNAASENSNATTVPDDFARSSAVPLARDPLWLVFKNLESEYTKLLGKTPQAKMNLVRTVLVPFLRNYAAHPSNKKLRPEDYENRANVLDKWWKGLLEMLDARLQRQAVPGVERETLHEVTTLVMMRPEWRHCTASFKPFADRDPREPLKQKKDTERSAGSSINDGSGSGADSDFITESAEHNVRNLFRANLLTQIAIVVDKLSQRQTPPSLVNFAGKTCAYAFFFVPSVADVLVRLWSLTPNLVRRVADEFNLPRYKGEVDDIVAFFPSNLESLRWKSVHDMSTCIRTAPKYLPAVKIAWQGPWLSKWRGRDSDLFFIFCKYYFILAEEFIPSELPLSEKARAPGFVLVNAQILATLDSTVHRQASLGAVAQGPPLADAFNGADASATQFPGVPNNNAMKGMDDNRLIVLLKNFLSTGSVALADARHTFAEAFMALTKASAKRTSQFDHDACFTLCDFLQQSLAAYDSFVDIHNPNLEYIDWPFWFEVWKRILESKSTISEVRVLCLIHTLWDAITSDARRKESLCLDWLLTEKWFDQLFNSYSPMIRAFYMRLLCWRVCRDTGSTNELDAIFVVVSTRLKTAWSHYLWLKQEAETDGQQPPPTAPCPPTPGRRFTIHCIKLPGLQTGLMMGFDAFSKALVIPEPVVSNLVDTPSDDPSPNKKWKLFGKVLSLGTTNSSNNDLEALRRETAAARKPRPPPKEANGTVTPPASDSDSLGSSPTYEASQRIFKFTLLCMPPNTMPLPNRNLTRPRLPLPAQARVSMMTRGRSGSPPPEASRPAPTRAISGSTSMGLIEAAKNADPSEATPMLRRASVAFDRRDSVGSASPIARSDDEQLTIMKPSTSELFILPVKPQGMFASGAKYSGQALAEWSMVVAECNNFVDRRREEGVLGLSEIEVPILEVEGFRKPG